MSEQTKEITFEGKTYTVPLLVNYVARDILLSENKP